MDCTHLLRVFGRVYRYAYSCCTSSIAHRALISPTSGACLVWLHYLPHFKTIPEPPPDNAADALLRPRDYLNFAGLRIAGYNTGQNALRPV